MQTALAGSVIGLLGCGSSSGDGERQEVRSVPEPSNTATRNAPPDAAIVLADARPLPKDTAEAASLAVARFKGDNLKECVAVQVSLVRPGQRGLTQTDAALPLVEAKHLAVVLADDALSLGGATVLERGGKETISRFSAAVAEASWPNLAGKVKGESDPTMVREVAAVSWPPPHRAKDAQRGELAAVDTCALPNRIALGTCEVQDSTTTETGVHLEWSLTRYHFDIRSTTETDSGLKTCLRIGGKWSTPAKDDADATMERLRQRSEGLRGRTGH